MRITNNRITRNYLANLNKNMELYSKQNDKIASGRSFTKISQNVSGGRKALELRTQAYRNEQYQNNIKTAQEQLDIAESSLSSISEVMTTIKEKAIKAANGTNDQTALDVYSDTFGALKSNILQFANATYVDKYVLGGTNGKTAPFTTDASGNLLFNGVATEDITATGGAFYDQSGDLVSMSANNYIDIGLGIEIIGGKVDDQTAFNVTTNGLDALGYGTDTMTYSDAEGTQYTETVPKNVYQLIGKMQEALDSGDSARLTALNDKFTNAYDQLMTSISGVGVKSSYLETVMTKYEDEETSISTMQTNLEGIQDADEIVRLNDYKYSWQLTLQFGSNLLPQTLMDYLN
ncbi:MAG: hypothetical protein QM689_07575 [Oscillospiraceae bacterium]